MRIDTCKLTYFAAYNCFLVATKSECIVFLKGISRPRNFELTDLGMKCFMTQCHDEEFDFSQSNLGSN